MSEHWVMTDPIPLSENFKERYEMVLREKIDLRAKLEESEDRRFKMQRDHKRELEKMGKALRTEAREVREEGGREGGREDNVGKFSVTKQMEFCVASFCLWQYCIRV